MNQRLWGGGKSLWSFFYAFMTKVLKHHSIIARFELRTLDSPTLSFETMPTFSTFQKTERQKASNFMTELIYQRFKTYPTSFANKISKHFRSRVRRKQLRKWRNISNRLFLFTLITFRCRHSANICLYSLSSTDIIILIFRITKIRATKATASTVAATTTGNIVMGWAASERFGVAWKLCCN